jgi:hypothetical protein
MVSTGATKRYPHFGIVSMNCRLPARSPRALRSIETLWARLSSSTKLSGQMALMSSRFSSMCPLLRTNASRVSNALGGTAITTPSRMS